MKYRDQPCERCGWKFPGFHICLDRPPHVMRRVEDGSEKPKRSHKRGVDRDSRNVSDAYKSTDEWKNNISAGMLRFRETQRQRNQERDRLICQRYSQDERTIRELAAEFELSDKTIMDVLHRAREEGDLVIRPAARRVRS